MPERISPPRFLVRLFRHVLPIARHEIVKWTDYARTIPDANLRVQALASLRDKRFHADGGCVYAVMNSEYTADLVRLIVALQTISDYLDNLCDRCGSLDIENFHQLHLAMRDAVNPDGPIHAYYARYDSRDDGGYLEQLVKTCQQEIRQLPSYRTVQEDVAWLVERYCELQENKHIDPSQRETQLTTWWHTYAQTFPRLYWWEFAAATGSTLAVFALFSAATRPLSESTVRAICTSYFPALCGLHILLDYLIDLDEDFREGDFNFVRCYPTAKLAKARIKEFAKQSLRATRRLPAGGTIHGFIVKGLLGMYLSDKKVKLQPEVKSVRRILWAFGPTTWVFYGACMVYRAVR